MIRRISAVLFAVVLAIVFSTLSFAQDSTKAAQKEQAKTEMMKMDKAPVQLYTASCDPACAFMVQSHDKKEVADVIIRHAMTAHKKKVTQKEAMAMIKTSEATPPKE